MIFSAKPLELSPRERVLSTLLTWTVAVGIVWFAASIVIASVRCSRAGGIPVPAYRWPVVGCVAAHYYE